jgi:hypothetical protein
VFLADQPARLARILKQVKVPLRDAAAMNATRWQLPEALATLGRPVRISPGWCTEGNRSAMDLAKTHTLDALSAGHLSHEAGDVIVRYPGQVLVAKARLRLRRPAGTPFVPVPENRLSRLWWVPRVWPTWKGGDRVNE